MPSRESHEGPSWDPLFCLFDDLLTKIPIPNSATIRMFVDDIVYFKLISGPADMVALQQDVEPISGPADMVALQQDVEPISGPADMVALQQDVEPISGPADMVALQQDVEPISGWIKGINLRLNSKKTESLVISRKRHCQH